MNLKNILYSIIISQVFFLGVFSIERKEYFVTQSVQVLCGSFTPGTYEDPNWLPNSWSADKTCETESFESCCEKLWFQYIWTVWDPEISRERYAAEFLSWKEVIESQSLSPQKYNLGNTITRKEIIKVIANISKIELNSQCNWFFTDVLNDWGCKYIESALREWFIADNNTFRPDETLSQAEALKLIFKARWLSKRYETNSWQQDYISSAYYLWYIEDKPDHFNTPATRGWIFLATARSYDDFK